MNTSIITFGDFMNRTKHLEGFPTLRQIADERVAPLDAMTPSVARYMTMEVYAMLHDGKTYPGKGDDVLEYARIKSAIMRAWQRKTGKVGKQGGRREGAGRKSL